MKNHWSMMNWTQAVCVFCAALALSHCTPAAEEPAANEPVAAEEAEPTAAGGENEAEPEAEPASLPASQPAEGMIELTAEGTIFDPPISKDRVPDGAWICDMGTVDYASGEPGDGTCPVCNMRLVQHRADGGSAGGDRPEAAGDHGEHAGLDEEMEGHDDIMRFVREEGEYDPADVKRQPGAALGDLARCPISGEVFEITEDHAFLEYEGQNVYFCCPSCIRRFQRDPERFLEEQG